MASNVVRCLLCFSVIPDSKDRRNISYGEGIKIKDVIRGILLSNNEMESRIDLYMESSSIVCKKTCYPSVTKLMKLREDIKSLSEKLERTAKISFDNFGSGCRVLGKRTNPGNKSPGTPRKRLRKEQPNTPTRRFLNSTVVDNESVVAVVEKNKSRHKIYRLTNSLSKLGKSVGRRSRKSIAFRAVQDRHILKWLLPKIGKKLKNELISTVSKSKSMFKESSVSSLYLFDWEALSKDFKKTNPMLSTLLEACIDSNRSTIRCPNKNVILSVVAGILLRNTSQRCNLLQTMFSLLLYASHSPKKIYSRLQKVCLSLAHKSTVTLVDKLGFEHDTSIITWKKEIFEGLLQNTNNYPPFPESVQPEMNDCTTVMTLFVESSDNETNNGDTTSDYLSDDSPRAPHYSRVLTSSESEEESDSSFASFLKSNLIRELSLTTKDYSTFKVVIDNLDLFIRPRSETSEHHAETKHFVNVYAVKDRIPCNILDNTLCVVNLAEVDVQDVLPKSCDVEQIKQNLTVIVSRLVRQSMTYFRKHISAKAISQHIKHKFSKEMAQKSEVVPLGIIMKNENKNDDMICILECLQKYAPSLEKTETVVDPETNESVTVTSQETHWVLIGGDQLTVERIRGCRRSRHNADTIAGRLNEFIPVVEDWHSKVALLKVIWKRLYNTASGADVGTLYHLRNLLQRRCVTKKVKNDPTVCEEFFLLVAESHILYAIMNSFGMNSLEDSPSNPTFSDFKDLSAEEREKIFLKEVRSVVDKHFNFSNEPSDDNVLSYAEEIFSLGLFLMEFIDGIREGDGNRILRCWKYMLLMYKSSNKTKYSVEAFNLLAQYQFIFSERLRDQLLWSRTVNTHGKAGRNVPMDLHMEHLNRMFKDAICKLGPNTVDTNLQRTGKALKALMDIKQRFDLVTGTTPESPYHTFRSNSTDLKKIIEHLQDARVFDASNRKHQQFSKLKGSVINMVDKTTLKDWMSLQLKRIIRYTV